MFWAITALGETIEPSPGIQAICPLCHEHVIPKCGDQITWHFAHEARDDCDPWGESEGPWHKSWKMQLPKHQREVVLGPHRADMVAADRVIELQHSPLSVAEVLEREAFYNRMIWLFDLTNYRIAWGDEHQDEDDEDPRPRIVFWRKEHYWTFYWAHPKRSVIAAKRQVFVDLGEFLFEFREARSPRRAEFQDRKQPLAGARTGWGKMWAKKRFLRAFVLPEPVAKTQAFIAKYRSPIQPIDQPTLL